MFGVKQIDLLYKKDKVKKYFVNSNSNDSDYAIANICKIDLDKYRNILIEQFNGATIGEEVYFDNLHDCKSAAEWVNSIVTMNKLS